MNFTKESTISSINTDIEDTNTELDEIIELMSVVSNLSNCAEREPFINTIRDDDIIEITNTVYELSDEYLKENVYLCLNLIFT